MDPKVILTGDLAVEILANLIKAHTPIKGGAAVEIAKMGLEQLASKLFQAPEKAVIKVQPKAKVEIVSE